MFDYEYSVLARAGFPTKVCEEAEAKAACLRWDELKNCIQA